MIVIGLSGKARSGKDTIADYIVENYNAIKIPFARSLKEIARILYGFTDEEVYSDKKDNNCKTVGQTPRSILITLAETLRGMDEAIFINVVKRHLDYIRKMDKSYGLNTAVIITDVRYKNEFLMIQQEGGYTLRIRRNDGDKIIDFSKHKSEVDLDNIEDKKFDFIIEAASGEIDKLHLSADQIMQKLKGEKIAQER